jgi:hypothetical protein
MIIKISEPHPSPSFNVLLDEASTIAIIYIIDEAAYEAEKNFYLDK